jgi:CheY-like chemotaxis protein
MGLRLLVVDDESDLRLSLGLALRLEGHEVLEADTGHAALQQVSDHLLDAVLLDLRLPDLDGWEVIERLRELGHFPRLPVVVGSADADPAARRRALDLGCAGYLVKPFEPATLLSVLADPPRA